jgi:hypothetical protein
VERLRKLYDELYDLCKADEAEARKLIGDVPMGASVPESAAWVVVARALLNLDEVVTRE